VCDSCQKAKSHQLPYPISTSVSTVPLEQIFSDVWGPTPASVNKHSYYVSFIDDFSKFTWIYLIKKRSDVYQVFFNFQKLVEQKFGRKIITMQTDWGSEYEKLHSFFQKMALHIMYLAHMLTNKMVPRNANTATLLKLDSLCLPMPPCLSNFGMKLSLRRHFS
jgi:hypothetical protein